MKEPYAKVYGYLIGDPYPKSEWFELPIVLDEFNYTYRIQGIQDIRWIEIMYIWPNKEKDILELQKLKIKREREEIKERTQRYQRSRIVKKGRALYDETLYYDL